MRGSLYITSKSVCVSYAVRQRSLSVTLILTLTLALTLPLPLPLPLTLTLTLTLTLQAEAKECKYYSSTLSPVVNKYIFERYPGIGAAFPAILTHKAAISMEAMMMITRAARTSQTSHDLEAMFHEFRCLKAARDRLGFYQMQHMSGVQPANVSHYNVGISSISDTYITEAINTFHETHLRCAR